MIVGVMTIAGQVARFRGDVIGDVRPFDDMLAGALLLAASAVAARPAWLAAAWALFTGVHLTTLVVTAHDWVAGGKAGGPFYTVVLAAITLAGAATTFAAARR
jgi:hypothetical protein